MVSTLMRCPHTCERILCKEHGSMDTEKDHVCALDDEENEKILSVTIQTTSNFSVGIWMRKVNIESYEMQLLPTDRIVSNQIVPLPDFFVNTCGKWCHLRKLSTGRSCAGVRGRSNSLPRVV